MAKKASEKRNKTPEEETSSGSSSPQETFVQIQNYSLLGRLAEFVEATRECLRSFRTLFYASLVAWLAWGVPATVQRGGNFLNVLAVIGDDFAAGAGDGATLGTVPGPARHLRRELVKNPKIKQTWRIYNCGVAGTTSLDWVPSSEISNSGNKKSQFDRVFSNSVYASASVVVVLVGSNDNVHLRASNGHQKHDLQEISPEQTQANIHSICKVLTDMGKIVFVCPIANFGDSVLGGAALEDSLRRNELIAEYLSGKKESGLIFIGPNLNVLNYEYRSPRYYEEDGRHFNTMGYMRFGRDLADLVVNMMVKIEFSKFIKKMGVSLDKVAKEIKK